MADQQTIENNRKRLKQFRNRLCKGRLEKQQIFHFSNLTPTSTGRSEANQWSISK